MDVPLQLQAELFAMRHLISRMLTQVSILAAASGPNHKYADRNVFLRDMFDAVMRDIDASDVLSSSPERAEILREMIKERLSELITRSSKKS